MTRITRPMLHARAGEAREDWLKGSIYAELSLRGSFIYTSLLS